MKEVKEIAKSNNFTAVNIGDIDKISEYSIIHPKLQQAIQGKVFVKDATNAGGMEISFNSLPPKTELPYFHRHFQNEETYIFLKGSGDFQVDEDCFPIQEGCVVRVAPTGIRCFRNTSDEPMIYIVIQSKENSLAQYSHGDGERVAYDKKWKE